MQIKCDYCDSMVDEKEQVCPHCGAPLNGSNRFASSEPKTIEELQQWYTAHHLPPEQVTRFFIGRNVTEPRAFGIYEDANGDFVVYKNKSNGERAIRYRGSDEAYAVNELYQKLRTEIANQKSNIAGRADTSTRGYSDQGNKKKGNKKLLIVLLLIFFGPTVLQLLTMLLAGIGSAIFFSFYKGPTRGYYQYGGTDYYYQDSSWYYYDDTIDDWSHTTASSIPEELTEDSRDYRIDDHEGKSFEDSEWYREPDRSSSYSHDDDWDSSSDWDYSSSDWDSGSSDWDSDW